MSPFAMIVHEPAHIVCVPFFTCTRFQLPYSHHFLLASKPSTRFSFPYENCRMFGTWCVQDLMSNKKTYPIGFLPQLWSLGSPMIKKGQEIISIFCHLEIKTKRTLEFRNFIDGFCIIANAASFKIPYLKQPPMKFSTGHAEQSNSLTLIKLE